MELQHLSRRHPAARVVAFRDGTRVLYSYDEPAALYLPGRGFVQSSLWKSPTTAAHVRRFVGSLPSPVVPHSEILRLVAEL